MKQANPLGIVHDIGKLNLEGNVIPHNWFCHLKYKNGKPHTNAAIILSEIVYWYRPTLIKDEVTGRVIEERKKFKADKLQRSYDSFATQFGFTKRQAKDAIKFLGGIGVIGLEFRHITLADGSKLANVLFIEPIIEKLNHITFERNTSDIITPDPLQSNGIPDTVYRHTNTDTTTEITTEITTEGAAKKTPPATAKKIQFTFDERSRRGPIERSGALAAIPRPGPGSLQGVDQPVPRQPGGQAGYIRPGC